MKSLEKGYKGSVGCPKCKVELLHYNFQSTPLPQRSTLAAIKNRSGVSVTTLHRALRRGDLRSEPRRKKPLLTTKYRIERIEWYLSGVNLRQTSLPLFSILDYVHVDEKWLHLAKIKGRVITVLEKNWREF